MKNIENTLSALESELEGIDFSPRSDKATEYQDRRFEAEVDQATIAFAERWARLMQKEMEGDAERIFDIAEACFDEANTEEISGAMLGCAVDFLSEFWEHGDHLESWLICYYASEAKAA